VRNIMFVIANLIEIQISTLNGNSN